MIEVAQTITAVALERRTTRVAVELREAGNGRTIGGLAAVFGRYSQNLGGFVEEVTHPAFNRSKGNGWPDVLARYNHDDNMLLGTTGGGTLRLSVTPAGLEYDVDPPGARQDVVELVQRGDVRSSSFAFRTRQGGDEWATTEQGYPLRRLITVELVDVAPVNSPAYTDTTSALRSLANHVQASIADVRRYAQKNELRHLIVRTDGQGPRAQLTPRVHVPAPPPPKTPRQLAADLEGRRHDPCVGRA